MMYIADFETTVLPDSGKQTETEVCESAAEELP